ncbi:MAG: peptidoglycan DD-metalloendopeptidase family protein [Candidatus Peribacteraceae bacterium]|nr:peptidoglycan DD-metalloendopeptidase family protein [Candidatus Peribacteraceae bacterium]
MHFRFPSSRWLAILLVSLCVPTLTSSQVVATDDEFTQAKTEFDSMLHKAAESSQRKAQLEQDLAAYNSTVKEVQDALLKTTQERKQVRTDIAQRKELIAVLEKQIASIRDTKSFYTEIQKDQKAELVTFVRYVATRQMEVADTGPVVGGSIIRQMLRGSLGDIIEQDLSRQALLTARRQFLSELSVYMTENDSALLRLEDMEGQLQAEVLALQSTYESLQKKAEEVQAVVDMSWQQKVLTEQELQQVQNETSEVDNELAAMQSSLLAIHTQLKEAKLKQLSADMATLEQQKKDFMNKKLLLQATEVRLTTIDDEQLRALNNAMSKRNTDKNLYKRVGELQLKISQKEKEYAQKLQTVGALTGSGQDAEALKVQAAKEAEVKGLQTDLQRMRDTLALLQQGVPLDYAEDYTRKKLLWTIAEAQLKTTREDIVITTADLAKLETKISDLQAEIDGVKDDSFQLKALRVTDFIWPVKGYVTAGFYDTAYQKVFHVPHRAIDIATMQGTSVRATADGIIFHVRLGGAKGYTYVLIGHRNGYASLYGHLSKVLVKNGDIIAQGQIIGLSGGRPGTDGAGPMTTGAHLHFEITKNGAHMDPRSVLPGK